MRLKVLHIILLSLLFTFISEKAKSQLSSYRYKWIKASDSPVEIDTLTIEPGSIVIKQPTNSSIKIDYNINTNKAYINGENVPDSIQICYRVFPINFSKSYFKRDISLYDSNQVYSENATFGVKAEPREEIFETPGINKSGVITRGITVGNTQNVFVNSSLNLQLEGKLSDDISMIAAISDQNVPFQPEGNTQTINEFDKVFIKFYNKNGSLTAGDLVLQNNPSNFLKYYRNVQGGQFEMGLKQSEKSFSTTKIGAAVSKGKFASVPITPAEGVQGPYKIRVSEADRFVIILANSERVYVDGVQLKRGFNYDYIIDYNQAEITFTNSVLITRYSRIRVDVEYAERNYARSIVTASHEQVVGKTSLSFNYFNQKDNPRNPLLLELSESDKELLSQVGDNLAAALAPTIDSVAFDINKVLYKKIDTVTASGTYTVFKYSIKPEEANFEILFSEVGPGRGDYELVRSTRNGRVFAWVEPIGGKPSGSYAPVQLLPTPIKNQIVALGGVYNISKADRVFIEGALSTKDVNLYSPFNDNDNQGAAYKVGYENKGRKIYFLKDYNWIGAIDYEFNSKTFSPIDRFRSIEFDRDWSVDPAEVLIEDENIFNVGGGVIKNSDQRLEYKFTRRLRGREVNGFQHRASLYQKAGKIFLRSDYFYLDNRRPTINSYWQRLKADVSFQNSFLIPGYIYEFDKNLIRDNQTNKIKSTQMYFDDHKVYLQTSDTSKINFRLDYSYRVNNFPSQGEMEKKDEVQTVSAVVGKNKGDNSYNFTLTYRDLLNFPDSTLGKREKTVMGRIDLNQYILKKNVRFELTYFSFSGRELRREFVYLPVATGEGTHTWRDENSDGVKDLNEFYEAINPDERSFVKFFVPTDTYIDAYSNNLNYRLNVSTPTNWRAKKGYKRLLSHFSLSGAWTIDKKTTSENIESRILPFVTNVIQDNIISFRESLRSTMFFNKTHSVFGLDLNYYSTKYKQPLTNGYELRIRDEYRLNGRLNLKNTFNTRIALLHNTTEASSDYLAARNFLINSYKVIPEISFQPKNNFRATATYSYTFKSTPSSPEKEGDIAMFNEWALDVKWTKLSNRTLQSVFRITNINFDGDVNNAQGYEMLEALKPGINYNWSLNWLQKLSNGLQLSLNYEGRKSESQKVIHVGRMQLAALF